MSQFEEESLLQLPKKQLVSQLLDYKKRFDEYLETMKSDMAVVKNEMFDMKGKFDKMEAELSVSKNVNSRLQEKIVYLERQCAGNSQYSRSDLRSQELRNLWQITH